jgi:hypothetical protein
LLEAGGGDPRFGKLNREEVDGTKLIVGRARLSCSDMVIFPSAVFAVGLVPTLASAAAGVVIPWG